MSFTDPLRATVVLAFTGAIIFLGVTGSLAPEAVLAPAGIVIGYTLAIRQSESEARARRAEEPIEAPFIGDEPVQAPY